MKKVIVVVFLILSFCLPASSKIITGEIHYSVNGAREEVFGTKPANFDREKIKTNLLKLKKKLKH